MRENEADILDFADSDDWNTLVFAEVAIRQILKVSMRELPKKLTIPFELEQEKMRYGSGTLRTLPGDSGGRGKARRPTHAKI